MGRLSLNALSAHEQRCQMPDESNPSELLETSLKALRLRPGIALEIQCRREGSPLIPAKFVAAIEGKGVMLTPSGADGRTADIRPGDEYGIRGFTGQTDFVFLAPVLNVFTAPFAHALFAYPATVRARQVRRAMRMKTRLPARISPRGQDTPHEVSIVDLSTDGALITAPGFLGSVGSLFDLAFPIRVDDVTTELNLVAKLRHRTGTDAGDGRIGLSFENVTREHKLLLGVFVASITAASSFVIEA